MRRRVLERTDELPPGALWINEAAFELFKARFEPLGEDEVHIFFETDAEPMAPADGENRAAEINRWNDSPPRATLKP